MAEPDQIADMRELRAKVAILEGARQASRIDLRDELGTLRVRLGRQDDLSWGLRIWNASGAVSFDETAS